MSIGDAMRGVRQYYAENPAKAVAADAAAVAVVEDGLRCRATGPNGATLVSDMPAGIGGGASAPTPGWLMRAALANCDATVIALRAAELGIALRTLEVTVESVSDNRGLVGSDVAVDAGPQRVSVRVRLAADGVSPDRLREVVRWAEEHSPVGDAIRRAIPVEMQVELD